jgi:hypothetical protein
MVGFDWVNRIQSYNCYCLVVQLERSSGILPRRRIICFLGTDTQNARTNGEIYSEVIDKLPHQMRETKPGQN